MFDSQQLNMSQLYISDQYIDTGAQFCVVLKHDTLREVEQKYLESLEIWCWEDRVRDALSRRVKDTNIVRKFFFFIFVTVQYYQFYLKIPANCKQF